jgi:hypothetical protein
MDDTCDKEISFLLDIGDIPVMVNGINSSSKSSICIKPETKKRYNMYTIARIKAQNVKLYICTTSLTT